MRATRARRRRRRCAGSSSSSKTGIKQSHALIARVQNAGIEASDQELALREAASTLTLARTEMHAFDPSLVAPVIAQGMKILEGVDTAGQKGVAELRFRRRGLAISLGAILLLVVALASEGEANRSPFASVMASWTTGSRASNRPSASSQRIDRAASSSGSPRSSARSHRRSRPCRR